MNYFFPQLNHKSRFLTYGVVKNVLESNGHTVQPEEENDTDFALYSLSDVTDLKELAKFRQLTDKSIIAGGHFAINFWSTILHADFVWLGEIFDFAKLQTRDEIENSSHIYKGGSIVGKTVSSRIEWDKLPVIQTRKRVAYYLGGVGCKNYCKFCHTSWTHKHQVNSSCNIKKAIDIAKKHKVHLTSVSNEYEQNYDLLVRDMMGVDYIKIPVGNGGVIRIGIEFPTEETRRYMGKPLSRDDLFKILQKAAIEKVSLRLFHIGGYNTLDEWNKYIDEIGWMLDQIDYRQLLYLQFTNLQYQNYTPLYDERRKIDHKKYLTKDDTRRWYDILRRSTRSVLVGPPSPFAHVAWRMGVELSRTEKQMDFWMKLFNKRKKVKPAQMQDLLVDTGVLDTPRYVLKYNTGEIREIK